MRFGVNGGSALVQRKLKWWALEGLRADVTSRLSHQGLQKAGPNDDETLLPVLEVLDGVVVDPP